MKIFKKHKKLLIFLLLLGVFLFLNKISKDETIRIFRNGKYTVGTVTDYFLASGSVISPVTSQPMSPPRIKYSFTVDGKEYITTYDALTSKVPFDEVSTGSKYLVIYLPENPKKSRMLFNYPIKDSADFKRCVKMFEMTRAK
ncbi:MAG: hypothetical protein JXR65_08645 [Bacteroidales bacterium]|nr:hypothetical protein [Bacteroidales bacterium]